MSQIVPKIKPKLQKLVQGSPSEPKDAQESKKSSQIRFPEPFWAVSGAPQGTRDAPSGVQNGIPKHFSQIFWNVFFHIRFCIDLVVIFH